MSLDTSADVDAGPVGPVPAVDAEVSLLGAAMSGADVDDLAGLVEPSDFYDLRRGEVWSAILRVHRAGTRPDPVSVRVALDEVKAGLDPLELLRFCEMCPTPASAPFYAEAVAVAAGKREIYDAGTRLHTLACSGETDLDDIRETARGLVDGACRSRTVSRARTIADLLPEVIDVAQNGRGVTLSTPWPDLDRLIGGLAPGRLVVVGARPGIGKSLMGTNLALHFASRHSHAALVASLEMPELEVGQRMLAAHARVNLTDLVDGRTSEGDWDRIAKATASIDALPITVDDAPEQTVTHIRRRARDVQRVRDDLALIVVDYLQLVTPRDTRANASRAEQLGQVSRDLKLLARETGACVVAMAQVNRDASKRNDRPRMSDLRESGAIEADADQVILLHQPDDDIPELEVIVDKNRHGPKGHASLAVYGHYARLASVTGNWREANA